MFYTSNPEKTRKKLHPYKENFKSAQALAWKDVPRSGKTSVFQNWFVDHLPSFSAQNGCFDPKTGQTHGNPWLTQFISFYALEMCQKCLVIALLCSFCLLVLCIFSEKLTRFISVSHSDRLTVPPSGPLCTSTPSASPIEISAGAFLPEKW